MRAIAVLLTGCAADLKEKTLDIPVRLPTLIPTRVVAKSRNVAVLELTGHRVRTVISHG
jgi:hypothetical protein